MSTVIPLRVTVLDTWDEIAFDLPPDTAVGELKSRALAASHVTRSPAEYQVKYLGAELTEEGASLAESGVVANSALIVLSRRRRPSI